MRVGVRGNRTQVGPGCQRRKAQVSQPAGKELVMSDPNECPWIVTEDGKSRACGVKCWGTDHCDEHQNLVDKANEASEFILFKVEYDLRNKD